MDAPKFYQLSFQDPATPFMEGLMHFHHHLAFCLMPVVLIVFWLLLRCLFWFIKGEIIGPSYSPFDDGFFQDDDLETIWTLLPAAILFTLAMPSFGLLYSMSENVHPSLTLKVVGHQWYWSYEYPEVNILEEDEDETLEVNDNVSDKSYVKKLDFGDKPSYYYNAASANHLIFDSYIVKNQDLSRGGLRVLEVDRRVVLPEKTHIRILVTAADTIHSWAIPSLGLKLDGCPGRIQYTTLYVKRRGVYYGQCSEICGVHHGFMPIVIRVVSKHDFNLWQVNKYVEFKV